MHEFDFPITTRISARAKRIHAYVKLDGIEVALPKYATIKDAYPLLLEHEHWFKQQWHALREQQHIKLSQNPLIWPLEIHLNSLNKTIAINIENRSTTYYLTINEYQFCLGRTTRKDLIHRYIKDWFKLEMLKYLEPIVQSTAQQMRLSYKKLQTNWVKSCWGSCSYNNILTFNALLFYFDQELINYIIIHECAHIRHKNHSRSFWNLVAQFCPNYVMIRRRLNEEAKLLPLWIFDSNFLPNIGE